jgi:hypothetical protein
MKKFMIVLFNLQSGKSPEAFREWMAANDFPVVSKLPSINHYHLVKTVGLLGADGAPPYSHMEIIEVNDFDQLGQDAQAPAVQAVGGQFASEWADKPIFMLVDQIL